MAKKNVELKSGRKIQLKEMSIDDVDFCSDIAEIVYNEAGEVVGVLWGVDAEYYPSVAIIEDMIWVVPIQKLNIDIPIKTVCKHNDLKFC